MPASKPYAWLGGVFIETRGASRPVSLFFSNRDVKFNMMICFHEKGLSMNDAIKIGISSCLLGENVRYNGGHSQDRFLTDTLGKVVQWVPVCPEVECGMSIPRETLRLVGSPDSPRLLTSKTGVDHTERMLAWAREKVKTLEGEGLCGFIFKSKSPSSGMERVKVYHPNGGSVKKGVGLFAQAFMNHFPRIPVEEEGRLHDPNLRENFIENIFILRSWRKSLMNGKKLGNLVDFHTRNKLLFLSHSEKHYRQMGKLVATGKSLGVNTLYDQYELLMMEALRLKPTHKKNGNVLLHMVGYFKQQLSRDEKEELISIIDQYRNEYVPLIVPLTLISHYVRKYDQPYLKQQSYLNPHPIELKLRNHV
ncbi:MAG: DUF523 and DUF1722 domain-containing protein [Desulfobacterales bacterium]